MRRCDVAGPGGMLSRSNRQGLVVFRFCREAWHPVPILTWRKGELWLFAFG